MTKKLNLIGKPALTVRLFKTRKNIKHLKNRNRTEYFNEIVKIHLGLKELHPLLARIKNLLLPKKSVKRKLLANNKAK